MTNILVVDDAVDAADALALLLSTLGHRVQVAFDGVEGVAEARRCPPHIIFLDLDMPRLDGFGAVKAIRQAPDVGNPFIIALTANAGSDVQSESLSAGFDFYMRKPTDTKALLALVADVEGRSRVRASAPIEP